MSDARSVDAKSGDLQGTFHLDFDKQTWHSDATYAEGAFPFVADVDGKRYELYSDGRFDEEEKAPT